MSTKEVPSGQGLEQSELPRPTKAMQPEGPLAPDPTSIVDSSEAKQQAWLERLGTSPPSSPEVGRGSVLFGEPGAKQAQVRMKIEFVKLPRKTYPGAPLYYYIREVEIPG